MRMFLQAMFFIRMKFKFLKQKARFFEIDKRGRGE